MDIILPKKRDRLGKRYGFVKTMDEREAGAIICNAKQDKRLGGKISMTINGKNENFSSHKKPTSEQVMKKKSNDFPVKATTNTRGNSKQSEEASFGKRMFEEEVSVLKERFRDMGLGGIE